MFSKLFAVTPGGFLYWMFAAGILCSTLTSCSNDDPPPSPVSYTAVLIDGTSGNPVPNHKVYLLKDEVVLVDWYFPKYDQNLIMPNTPANAVDSAITSATGSFTFLAPPNVSEIHFLRDYYPVLRNRDNIFCYKRSVPQTAADLDSFYTEPTRWLNLTMQKNTAAHIADTLMEQISVYRPGVYPGGAIHLKAQTGITNHTIQIPYSQHFASKVAVHWKYKGNLPDATGIDSMQLNPASDTDFTIMY